MAQRWLYWIQYQYQDGDKVCGGTAQYIISRGVNYFLQCIEISLAMEYRVIQFDFYNDWINGTLYLPLWFWKKRAKKKYFFGLFTRKAINTFCSCDKTYSRLFLSQSCSTTYDSNFKPLDIFQDSGLFTSLFRKKGDNELELSSLELKILHLLFINIGKVVKRNTILDKIWEWTGNDVDDHTITVYLKRIREKLGTDIIVTIKGIGYRIDEK